MTAASYSIAYVEIRRKQSGEIVHGRVWAAWWSTEAIVDGKWQSPDACGIIEQTPQTLAWVDREERAEIAADDLCREALAERLKWERWGAQVAGKPIPPLVPLKTVRMSDAFARAAFRELQGNPPNYRPSKPTRYATSRGFERPATMPAREFFGAFSRASPPSHIPDALRHFGLDEQATAADVNRVYRERVRAAHPDRGGPGGDFAEMKRMRDEALKVARP